MWKNGDQVLTDNEAVAFRNTAIRNLRSAFDQAFQAMNLQPLGHATQNEQLEFNLAFDALIHEGRRGSGRTTASILEAVARALRAPDRWITICEDDDLSDDPDEIESCLRQASSGIGAQLEIERVGSAVRIKSPLAELRCREPLPE